MCGCLSRTITGDLSRNPGMCPNWELNWRPFSSQACTQSTELHQPEPNSHFYLLGNGGLRALTNEMSDMRNKTNACILSESSNIWGHTNR